MPDSPINQPARPNVLTLLVPWLWRGYWVLLFVIMHVPRPFGARLAERLGDKLVHAAAYFILAALGGWTALRRGRRTDRAWLARWCIVYALYAAADELLQPLAQRVCQFGDWVADVIGAALALLLVFALTSSTRSQPDLPDDSAGR